LSGINLHYVENRSFRLDVSILAKTIWLLITGHGLAPD
jgi:lipopolysaccharide/colanic/teichoic acid biosynthesis glycosyltransferase